MSEMPVWAIMPLVNGRDLTMAAIADVLAQNVPTRVLVVGQGCDPELRRELERVSEDDPLRVFCWWFEPPLPSLSQCWNTALRFVWQTGGTEALVLNNDTRIDPRTVSILQAILTWPKKGNLFVSAVGVTQEQYEGRPDPLFPLSKTDSILNTDAVYDSLSHGGPDFSCYMISREAHEKYPFDEGFIPCYGEDCDTHRRYMLGGDGEKIFSINLPYHHIGHGSQTLKAMDPDRRAALERRIEGSREYYRSKWGSGGINNETLTIPFDQSSAQPNVTNPDLQRAILHPAEA